MNYNTKIKLFIGLIIGLAVLYSIFRTSIRDTLFERNRAWAFSSDKNAKLFVGNWEGQFKDPKGITKKIVLTIFTPEANNTGKRTFFREVTRNTRSFDGEATITSSIGVESYEIYGGFSKEDEKTFKFQVIDKKRLDKPNFYFQGATNGKWSGDEMSFTTGFNYKRVDGSSYSDSADPIYEYKTMVVLKKK